MAGHRHRHKRRTNRSLNDPINASRMLHDPWSTGGKNKTLLAGFSRAAINTSWEEDLRRKSWPMRMAHHVYFRDADESLTVRFPSCFLSKLSPTIYYRFVEFLLFSMIIFLFFFFFFFSLFLSVTCFASWLQNFKERDLFKAKVIRIDISDNDR